MQDICLKSRGILQCFSTSMLLHFDFFGGLFACFRSAPTGWMFVKFVILGSYEDMSLNWKFVYCRTKISGTLREDKSAFKWTAVRIILLFDSNKGSHCSICMAKLQVFTLLTAKCGSTTLQRRRIFAFPFQHWLHDRVTVLGTRTFPTLWSNKPNNFPRYWANFHKFHYCGQSFDSTLTHTNPVYIHAPYFSEIIINLINYIPNKMCIYLFICSIMMLIVTQFLQHRWNIL
jgi:hypothetical protein